MFTILLLHQISGSHSQSSSSFLKALLDSAISNYQPKYAAGIKSLLNPPNSPQQPTVAQNSQNFVPASAAQNSQNFIPTSATQYPQSVLPASTAQHNQRNLQNPSPQSSQNFISAPTAQNSQNSPNLLPNKSPENGLPSSTTKSPENVLQTSTTSSPQSDLQASTMKSTQSDLLASTAQSWQNLVPVSSAQNHQSALPTSTTQTFQNNPPNPQIAQNSQNFLSPSAKPGPQRAHSFLQNLAAHNSYKFPSAPIIQSSQNFHPAPTAQNPQNFQNFYRNPTAQSSQSFLSVPKKHNSQSTIPATTAQSSLPVPKTQSSQSSFPINLDIEAKLDYSSLKGTLYNIGQALYDFVDVAMVRSLVDLYMNKRNAPAIARSQLILKGEAKVNPREEKVRDGLTSLLGGIMGKQQCWQKIFCGLGELGKSVSGSSVAFLVLKSSVPSTWIRTRETIDLVKEGTYGECTKKFKCDSKRG